MTVQPQSLVGMLSSRHQESVRKQAIAAAMINKMLLGETLISVTSVAHLSGVSRNFIYSHKNLLHQLEAGRQTQLDDQVHRQRRPTHGTSGYAALQADLALAHQTIKRLRNELTELGTRHRSCLGEKAEAVAGIEDSATDTTAAGSDRLVKDNQMLHKRIETLQSRVNELLDDLTAERAATLQISLDTE